jgi:hypothetical protein
MIEIPNILDKQAMAQIFLEVRFLFLSFERN